MLQFPHRAVGFALALALLGSLPLAHLTDLRAGEEAPPPNLVLVVTDDLSPDLGCYGNPVIQTPHLDRLASEGVIFREAFCTTASCSASRSVILTGRYNHANGQYGHTHAYHHFAAFPSETSLPVRLEKAGYRTARIGKYHVAPESVFQFQTTLPGNARSPVEMARHCRTWLAQESEQPFFLYYCTSDPHRGGGEVQDDPLHPDRFGNRPQGYPGIEPVTYAPEQIEVPAFLPDSEVCRHELAQYYQSVSRIDQGIGELIWVLKETESYDNTLIVFTSDHGIAFPGAKTTVYEPGLHVPLLCKLPGKYEGTRESSALVSLVDLVPTFLEAAGIKSPLPPELHGESFWDQIVGREPRATRERIFASHTFHEITMYYPMRVVRTPRYKLIWNLAHELPFPFASDLWRAPTWQEVYQQGPDARYGQRTVAAYLQRPEFELYDLQTDPHETHNLAEAPQQLQRLQELQAELRAFQQRTDDPWILKWDYE